jgi:hypothetical protein
MTAQLRFRQGHVELHRLKVASQTVLQAGDLVYLDQTTVKPASAFPFGTDLAATQGSFAGLFLGVAHQPSALGETDDVSIDMSPMSVYEFEVTPSTFEVGDRLAMAGTTQALFSQRLQKVTSAALAIGRAAEYRSANSSWLKVQLASAFHPASSNVNAAIG